MKIFNPYILSSIILLNICAYTQAHTYICYFDGKVIYTSEKQKSCYLSIINGLDEHSQNNFNDPIPVSSTVALPNEILNDEIKSYSTSQPDVIEHILYDAEYGHFDQATIPLPPPKPPIFHNTTTYPAHIHHSAQSIQPITHLILPAKPPLTRREILHQEINREQTALTQALQQLKHATQQNQFNNIQYWKNQITDRQQNIQSLQQELRR